ncbi:phosphoglycerate kinase [Chloroflexota bacterium]
MPKMTVKDIDVRGKKVLVRVDFNIPLDKKTGAITDDSRIRATLPTLKYLIDQDARIILISHLGRPKGKVIDELRLTPVAQRLSQILGKQVGVAADCIGPEVEKSVEALRSRDVLLLENLRFHSDEETGSSGFAEALARLGDVFVNDAFGTSHRTHASIAGIAQYLPAVAGFLLAKEIETLGSILEQPAHPFCSLLGGAKVSDKVGMLENIMNKVDCLLIGGGMAAIFLKAKSHEIGQSLIEAESVGTADSLMEQAKKHNIRVMLPVDVIVADEINNGAIGETVSIDKIPREKKIADIGPETIKIFQNELQKSKTVFWNGPLGVNEVPQFAGGTKALAKYLAELSATTIIGGGSTAEVVDEMGLADKMTFVSTGGGASLKFLGGETLPGAAALLDRKKHNGSVR